MADDPKQRADELRGLVEKLLQQQLATTRRLVSKPLQPESVSPTPVMKSDDQDNTGSKLKERHLLEKEQDNLIAPAASGAGGGKAGPEAVQAEKVPVEPETKVAELRGQTQAKTVTPKVKTTEAKAPATPGPKPSVFAAARKEAEESRKAVKEATTKSREGQGQATETPPSKPRSPESRSR